VNPFLGMEQEITNEVIWVFSTKY